MTHALFADRETGGAPKVTPFAQRLIAKAYLHAFIDWQLSDDDGMRPYFTGASLPKAVLDLVTDRSDPQTLDAYIWAAFEDGFDPSRVRPLPIEDFEIPGQSPSGWTMSGTNVEYECGEVDDLHPNGVIRGSGNFHDTRACKVERTQMTVPAYFALKAPPGDYIDASAQDFLSLRASVNTGLYGDRDPLPMPHHRPLAIELVDDQARVGIIHSPGLGTQGVVNVPDGGEVLGWPPIVLAMMTVRFPLGEACRTGDVDLSRITEVRVHLPDSVDENYTIDSLSFVGHPGDNLHKTFCDAPAAWTCNPNYYAANDGCDCACGVPDPDCNSITRDACQYCDLGGSCSKVSGCGDITAKENWLCVPEEWTCLDAYYAGHDGCDCGCGAIDPDCADDNSDSCDYCGGPGSCNPFQGCSEISTTRNWTCGGWVCPPEWQGTNDGCDCGCGEFDPDCSSSDVAACELCGHAESCNPTDYDCNEIDPGSNWSCE